MGIPPGRKQAFAKGVTKENLGLHCPDFTRRICHVLLIMQLQVRTFKSGRIGLGSLNSGSLDVSLLPVSFFQRIQLPIFCGFLFTEP